MSTNLADLPELRLSATPKESPIRERHEFGRGIVRELAKYLYKSPKSAFKEAVSNALDQMAKDDAKVEIYTDVLPDGDIVIEDWRTGMKIFRDSNTLQ